MKPRIIPDPEPPESLSDDSDKLSWLVRNSVTNFQKHGKALTNPLGATDWKHDSQVLNDIARALSIVGDRGIHEIRIAVDHAMRKKKGRDKK